MVVSDEKMQETVETAWDEFRARWHATMQRDLPPGLDDYPGDGTLQVRSEIHKAAQCLASVIGQLNGSGAVPDLESLRSYAVNMGLGLEGFTCMASSAMFLMDSVYSMLNGERGTVSAILEGFIGNGGPSTTFQSTSSKKPLTPEPGPSVEQVINTIAGLPVSPAPGRPTEPQKKSQKRNPAGSRKKSSPKKARKSSRKSKARGRKRGG